MAGEQLVEAGQEALDSGRWDDARRCFEAAALERETATACLGLAVAAWWQGENRESVTRCTQAYALFRRDADPDGAVQCAVWLAITYKANFGNFAAANGWLGRADRILCSSPDPPGQPHAWAWLARGYRNPDLEVAASLTQRALAVGRSIGDVDLELVALSQLGLIGVQRGEVAAGFALLDEAMAAALAGERSNLETVAYTCCDMLNACELVADLDRATQWCRVADGFVDTYGCPFLYAECRIYYGTVLATAGRWAEAARELETGLRITAGSSPGLHARAASRLAALRTRQGRLEEAEALIEAIGPGVEGDAEVTLAAAALLLARGDSAGASRKLEQRLREPGAHRHHLAAAVDLLVDARLAADDLAGAVAAVERLATAIDSGETGRPATTLASGRARAAAAAGDAGAVAQLEDVLAQWSRLELPFEVARTRFALGRLLAATDVEGAVEECRRALDGFVTLGADRHADEVAELLRSLGVVARVGAKGVGRLTDREQEVLGLVGLGLSNPEIAARLHISRKTAAHHVSNILMKLGLRNRAEAAAHIGTRMGAGMGQVPDARR